MSSIVIRSEPLTMPWSGIDPFLFCAHHVDNYPAATAQQGVATDRLAGRTIGNDFSRKDGFSMYYGTGVPGFPAHPHRGFETVTIVLSGLVDHSDSLGATARYGDGDVQWLTAGKGVMHAEMFPLRDPNAPNPLHLFQIWLNLPARRKMVDPAFVMLWGPEIPVYRYENPAGAVAQVKVIAGAYAPREGNSATISPLPAAPDSVASDPAAELAIWQVTLEPGATLTLPAAAWSGSRRALYVYAGSGLSIAGEVQPASSMIELVALSPAALENNGGDTVELILMQAVPIGEPVVAQGPFVMNTAEEIEVAYRDYHETRFGGWPWSEPGPVHAAGQQRFAKYPGSSEVSTPFDRQEG